ncbi:MAG TPA: penicillin acylase family protein, partial [Thermoanaerobaculia bacterium]|nr:penicillin acylase family protein [Thermoanaerobaculia bacterium]
WWWLAGGRAQRDGEATLAGLAAPVEVRWDRWGVPYVEAESEDDLAAALGWLHAADRFTQMELGRRLAAGRLAELAGERAISIDRDNRQLRLADTADRLWEAAGFDSRIWLTAYAGGVNAWIDSHRGDLPPDLRLLAGAGFEPEPWRPQDSLAFVLLMAQDLSFWNGRPEETRYGWLRAFGPERTADLVGGDPVLPAATVALAAGRPPGEGDEPPPGEAAPSDETLGSNNWALGGAHTASGAPLVANDPHLPVRMPGTWYQASLRAPGFAVAGMTLPGVPGVVIGRNHDLAWVLTNVMLDDHDLFFEDVRLDPDGRAEVRRGDAWVAVEVEEQEIAVRGGEPLPIRLLSTDRGPLLPAAPDQGLPMRSLAWTLFETEDADPLSAFFALAAAERADEALRAAVAGFVGPAQNLVAADRHGGLLWTVLGRAPRRLQGDGRLPAPGWDAAWGWDGLHPAADNASTLNPEHGTIVTANAEVAAGEAGAYPLLADYDSPHRAERIRRLLASGESWTPASSAAVQTDDVDLYALEVIASTLAGTLTDTLEGGDGASAETRPARQMLTSWDGRMAADSAPAALFAFFERELRRGVFGDEAAEAGLRRFDSRERLARILAGDLDPAWFDDVSTPETEGRREIVERALAAAWQAATERWGDDTSRWSYGDLRTLALEHPLGAVPLLGGRFNRGPFPAPGSATTVNALGARWRDGELRVSYAPSMR